MADTSAVLTQTGLGTTGRRDAWWAAPLLTFLGLTGFAAYAFWAILSQPEFDGTFGNYISPFYSPPLPELLGVHWRWPWPFLILWVPLGFRGTCYFFRKAYYRAYFLDPPACAVGEPTGRRYRGEAEFPFLLQNIHRYFLYLALIIMAFLWYDTVKAFFFTDPVTGRTEFGVGVGSVVFLVDSLTLSAFTFGCNSLRHLVGGKLDFFTCSSCARARHRLWKAVSFLNVNHREWAWISLACVGFADFYVRACVFYGWKDLRIF